MQLQCRQESRSLFLLGAFAFSMLMFQPATALAVVDGCGLGLRLSTIPVTVDGQEASSADWAGDPNARTITSGTGSCLEQLQDRDPISGTTILRDVTVKSKRYTRTSNVYYGFHFEIPDSSTQAPALPACSTSTQTCGCESKPLCAGERVVLQFNKLINGDTRLDIANDSKLEIIHKWSISAGSTITPSKISFSNAAVSALCGDGVQWVSTMEAVDSETLTIGGLSATVKITKPATGNKYLLELEVPASWVGVPAVNDIGVAFAIVNDFGTSSALTPSFSAASGVSFPSSLPLNNSISPFPACTGTTTGAGDWHVPNKWGVAYFNNGPATVSISRREEWWNSNAIDAFTCDDDTSSNYTYYPGIPCKLRIRAQLTNNGATTTRKALFLWAPHGAGDPDPYIFIALKRVVVNAGSSTLPVDTAVWSHDPSPTTYEAPWDGMPPSQPNHPCLRVYIFPETLLTTDETILQGVMDTSYPTNHLLRKTALDDVLTRYPGVLTDQWAQKNIQRLDTVTDCPSCKIIGDQRPSGPLNIAFNLIGTAYAETRPTESSRSKQKVSTKSVIASDAHTGDPKHAAGSGISLSGSDWERYGNNHVIVQARVYGYRVPVAGSQPPLYNFIEDLGGVIELFPVAMVQEKGEVAFKFGVTNSTDSRMQVKVQTTTHVPPGIPNLPTVHVKLAATEFTVEPNTTKQVSADVKSGEGPGGGRCPSWCGPCKKLGLASGEDWDLPGALVLMGGIAGVGGFAFRKRRRQARDRGPSA